MPKPAARVADATMHGPPLMGAGCPVVLVANMPAWRVSDQHVCPMVNLPPPAGPGTPHGPGVTMPPGSPLVLVGGLPAAGLGDQVVEPGAIVPLPPPNPILMGAPTVLT